MNVSEVRIKLAKDCSNTKLHAFADVVLDDCFVVRDLKIVHVNGRLIVFMPSRKRYYHCPKCSEKNQVFAKFCNHCGEKLPEDLADSAIHGRIVAYEEIAYPITTRCRHDIERAVMAFYRRELAANPEPRIA